MRNVWQCWTKPLSRRKEPASIAATSITPFFLTLKTGRRVTMKKTRSNARKKLKKKRTRQKLTKTKWKIEKASIKGL